MEAPPPVMRTGILGGPARVTIDPQLEKRLVSLVFVLVKRAASTAAFFCKHSKRTLVTVDDIKLALKFEARTFLDEGGLPDLERETAEIEKMVDEFIEQKISSEEIVDAFSECEDEEYPDTDDEVGEECSCETCRRIRNLEWDSWTPEDPAEKFIKDHVDLVLEEKKS